MATYDPKRPRPSSSSDPDEAPPVDALLDPPSMVGEPSDGATADDAVGADDTASPDGGASDEVPSEPLQISEPVVDEVDLRTVTSTNGNGSRPVGKRSAEVPIATAPEEGTANRAVLIAAVVSASVVAVLVALLIRRRRRAT